MALSLLGFSAVACAGDSPRESADAGNLVADGAPAVDAVPLPPDARPAPSCSQPAQLPLRDFAELQGFSGAEDFAFDAVGNLVSNDIGSITRQPQSGSPSVLAVGFDDTAGTRYLPGGDLVVASVDRGALVRISPSGSQTTILAGLAYPNGVEVDPDGNIYVAEFDAGRVRKVDADTGEFEILATGLIEPNGLSFSPDYETLYVGSFATGKVHAIRGTTVELFGQVGNPFDDAPLDGLTVDACGNVYVTEYIAGIVWRFLPTGGVPTEVVTLPSEWIPNLHWGSGIGGWAADHLYVMDRDEGRVFDLAVGVPEKTRVFP